MNTAAPTRVQLRRTKGWRMPANTVKVDRSTRWGNPFHRHGDGHPMDRALAVRLFTEMLEKQGGIVSARTGALITRAEIREQLRGKNLACWCPLGGPCHADVLLRVANEDPDRKEPAA